VVGFASLYGGLGGIWVAGKRIIPVGVIPMGKVVVWIVSGRHEANLLIFLVFGIN
jgi:hypothetical protein